MERPCYIAQYLILDDFDLENPQVETISGFEEEHMAVNSLIDVAEDLFIMFCKNHDPESINHYDFEDRREHFLETVVFQLRSTGVANVRVYNNHIRFEVIPTSYIETPYVSEAEN